MNFYRSYFIVDLFLICFHFSLRVWFYSIVICLTTVLSACAGIIEDRTGEEEGAVLSTKKVCHQSLG